MTPIIDKKKLQEMGFTDLSWFVYGENGMSKGYGQFGGNGTVMFHEDGTFNVVCHSSVFDEILADIYASGVPVVVIPLPVLQRWLSLAKTDGVNSKSIIAEEVQEQIDGYTTCLENQLPYKAKGE